jgi:hypothetical protein
MREFRPTQAAVADSIYVEKMKPNLAAPHVLLVPPKRAPFAILERAVVTMARQALLTGGSFKVTNANSLNWQSLRGNERNGACAWVARNFDAAVIVENSRGLLGRGVFDIAEAFIAARKPIGVPRELSQGWYMVRCGIVLVSTADWKTGYGRVDVDEAQIRVQTGKFCEARVGASGCGAPVWDTPSGLICENGHQEGEQTKGTAGAAGHELDIDLDEAGGW